MISRSELGGRECPGGGGRTRRRVDLDVHGRRWQGAHTLGPGLEAGRLCSAIATGIVSRLDTAPIRVSVLAVRPSDDWGELHGLYLPEDDGKQAVIKLWMRTAKICIK